MSRQINLKKVSKSTNGATSNTVKTFLSFCKELNIYSINIVDLEELKNVLSRFYAGCRTEKGELYQVNSMHSIHNGLQRHFLMVRNIDIINDNFFVESNACFQNVIVKIRSTVKGHVSHYPEIESEDLSKLYNSFNTDTPTGLLEKVWMDIMIYFTRRGHENLREMTWETFDVGTDTSGKRFVYQKAGENDKNHSSSDDQFDTIGEGHMYETAKPGCPVESFIKYVNHLNPKQTAFWQRPKENWSPTDILFSNVPLGTKYLGNILSKMSIKYHLCQRYTNHSVRVTGLQALEDANIEGPHIIRISGHKNDCSIKHYARKLSAARKRTISSVLSSVTDCGKENVVSSITECEKENILQSPQQANLNQTTTDFSIDLSTEDDDFLSHIPSSMLSRNSVMSSLKCNQPIFYNCSVTINYNNYNH